MRLIQGIQQLFREIAAMGQCRVEGRPGVPLGEDQAVAAFPLRVWGSIFIFSWYRTVRMSTIDMLPPTWPFPR
jgi:hypothetical protein